MPEKSLTFATDRMRLVVNQDGKEVAHQAHFKLDPSRKPKEIDVTELDGELKGKTTECLYELDGDTLRLCHQGPQDGPGRNRPKTLKSREGSTDYLWTLKRSDKEKLKRANEKPPPPSGGVDGGKLPTTPLPEDSALAPRVGGESGQKKPAAKHDFTNLQRLATALENYNYPEDTATRITVWCQGGGKGNSVQVTDAKTVDVAVACHYIVDGHHDKEGLDLENVAVMSADGRAIRFVNIKEKFAAEKPFGLNVNPGELVIVLQLRKD